MYFWCLRREDYRHRHHVRRCKILRKSYGKEGGTFQDQYLSVKEEGLSGVIIPPSIKIILLGGRLKLKRQVIPGKRGLLIQPCLVFLFWTLSGDVHCFNFPVDHWMMWNQLKFSKTLKRSSCFKLFKNTDLITLVCPRVFVTPFLWSSRLEVPWKSAVTCFLTYSVAPSSRSHIMWLNCWMNKLCF